MGCLALPPTSQTLPGADSLTEGHLQAPTPEAIRSKRTHDEATHDEATHDEASNKEPSSGGPQGEGSETNTPLEIRWAYRDSNGHITECIAKKGDNVMVDGIEGLCELRFGPVNSRLMVRRNIPGSESEWVNAAHAMSIGSGQPV